VTLTRQSGSRYNRFHPQYLIFRWVRTLVALHPAELAVEAELLGGDELLDGTCPALGSLESSGEGGGVDVRSRWLARIGAGAAGSRSRRASPDPTARSPERIESGIDVSAHPLGTVAWLDRLFGFHVGPYPSRGGPHTVRPDAPSLRSRLDSTAWKSPVVSEAGPSSRFVARAAPSDMAGYFLLPTGQAGNPLDPHYRDMGAVWTGSPLIELRPGRPPSTVKSELLFLPGSR